MDERQLQRCQSAAITQVIDYITDPKHPDTLDFTSIHFVISDRIKNNRPE
jgi:hypothetical protein